MCFIKVATWEQIIDPETVSIIITCYRMSIIIHSWHSEKRISEEVIICSEPSDGVSVWSLGDLIKENLEDILGLRRRFTRRV